MLNMRKLHRWVGVPAALFLLLASFTGVWMQCAKFFGPEEADRERGRALPSPVTAQSISAEFGVIFERTRAAAAARAGEQPLDKVVWLLKGEPPTVTFFFGSRGSQAARSIVVHARTGDVLRVEAYEENSLILRLHSGEVFGDFGQLAGMFWGISLFLLTVTGIIIYLRMKPRTQQTGLRKVLWTFVVSFSVAFGESARADSPFFTDDPLFSPGWEIKLGAAAEHNAGGDSFAASILDINYAVIPTVRLDLTMAYIGISPGTGRSVSGFGTTDFKVKWRFVEEDTQGLRPAVSIAPKVTLPTASTQRGLSDGIWRAQLPIELGKTLGSWYHFTEAGYQWAFDRSATDVAFWGAGTLYNFTKQFAAGAELYGLIPLEESQSYTFAATIGAVYTFNANWSLKASISQSLRESDQPGPRPAGVFYVVLNF